MFIAALARKSLGLGQCKLWLQCSGQIVAGVSEVFTDTNMILDNLLWGAANIQNCFYHLILLFEIPTYSRTALNQRYIDRIAFCIFSYSFDIYCYFAGCDKNKKKDD